MVYSENILVCIAIPLLIALIFTQRSTRRFIGSFVMGMLICLLSAYISGFVELVTATIGNAPLPKLDSEYDWVAGSSMPLMTYAPPFLSRTVVEEYG